MGFLSMMGLVTAEEHAKVTRERDTANSTLEMKKAELAQADATVSRQAGQLTAARNEATSLQTSLTAMTKERDEAVRNYSTMSGTVSERDAEILGLRAQLDAATEVINELKPLAEATKRRRANDANRVRPSRSKKATAPVATIPNDLGERLAKGGKAISDAFSKVKVPELKIGTPAKTAAKPAPKAKAAAKKGAR